MFPKIRRKLALRGYRARLGSYLDRHHRGHRMFTVAEVRAGSRALGLSQDYLPYAYALYCTREEFDAYCSRVGVRADYLSLRAEMLPPAKSFERRQAWSGGDTGPTGGDGSSWSDGDGGGGGDGGD